jgi:hypothetical protein
MDDNDRSLLDINKDNLTRTIGFSGTYDTKANFALTIILALTVTELPSYISMHIQTPAESLVCFSRPCGYGLLGIFSLGRCAHCDDDSPERLPAFPKALFALLSEHRFDGAG